MSRYISPRDGGESRGVITCARPRCREEHTWALQVEPPERSYVIERNMSDAERAARDELRTAAWREVFSHPLPAGWIKLKYMLYDEDVSGNPEFFEFHSAHCAALYLDSLPDAKGLHRDARLVGS